MSSQQLTLDELRKYHSFSATNELRLQAIIDQVTPTRVAKGTRIIELGDTSEFGYFLVSGSLLLKAADGAERTIEAGSESARNQIAQLVPRRYQVIATEPVTYLKVPNELMMGLQAKQDEPESSIVLDDGSVDYASSDISMSDSEYAFESEISYKLYQDLKNDQLILPSLPDIAVRVGKALNDETSDAHHIAEIVQTDPAIAAKLVKAANSAMYGGSNKVDSLSAAVVRLGTNLTHKLVTSFAIKELFRTKSALLQRRMKNLWSHSTLVAALSHVLAKKLGKFDPEHALLAGLVHDIGVVAILNYALDFPEAQENRRILDSTIKSLRAQIGNMILRNWGFPEGLPEVALDAENWMRNPDTPPDYSDLVIIAQLHSFIGHKDLGVGVPAIDTVPAFKRLKLSQLTPMMSLKILDEAKDEIAEARSLLQA
ncbi:MAG: HDOD domain-containing protein [Chromatiales bacterium]|jgi:HD-like signal output (HDOD) protein